MFYLISAILLSSTIVIVFKLFDKFNINITQAIVVNYLIAASLGFSQVDNLVINEIPQQEWFIFSIFSGIALILTFNVFAVSAQKVGIAITAVSSKMSVIIPITIGILIYKEPVSILKISGIIAALSAFYLTFKKDKNEIKKAAKYLILPILLFCGNGTNDSLLKHVNTFFIHGDTLTFLSTAFSFSFIIGLFIFGYSVTIKKYTVQLKNIVAGILLGLLNWGSTLYFLKGLAVFDSTIFFPVFNVSIVGISALIGYFIFKEKLSLINWIGIILAAISIILITFAATL